MNIEEFKSEVGRLGIAVTDREINLLERYYELLIEYNEKINLTAITDKQEVFLKHFYDSLTCGSSILTRSKVCVILELGQDSQAL